MEEHERSTSDAYSLFPSSSLGLGDHSTSPSVRQDALRDPFAFGSSDDERDRSGGGSGPYAQPLASSGLPEMLRGMSLSSDIPSSPLVSLPRMSSFPGEPSLFDYSYSQSVPSSPAIGWGGSRKHSSHSTLFAAPRTSISTSSPLEGREGSTSSIGSSRSSASAGISGVGAGVGSSGSSGGDVVGGGGQETTPLPIPMRASSTSDVLRRHSSTAGALPSIWGDRDAFDDSRPDMFSPGSSYDPQLSSYFMSGGSDTHTSTPSGLPFSPSEITSPLSAPVTPLTSLPGSPSRSGMDTFYEVEFKSSRRAVFRGAPGFKAGDFVIVQADRGEDLGRVRRIFDRRRVAVDKVQRSLARKAESSEVSELRKKSEEEEHAQKVCAQKVLERKLPLEVVSAEFQFDRNKLTFFYRSECRVDFRELVRDLFKIYRVRIWMQKADR